MARETEEEGGRGTFSEVQLWGFFSSRRVLLTCHAAGLKDIAANKSNAFPLPENLRFSWKRQEVRSFQTKSPGEVGGD